MRDPFTDKAQFDFASLQALARVGVRMLDNVLDLSYWPIEAQRSEAMAKRRIGLGFTGLADALLMMGLHYASDQGRSLARRIALTMRDAAYMASIQLAREKGAFPALDARRYLESDFAQRLPRDIRELIAREGIRNSHLLSIAPTGTVSLAFGDNCSSGIEPVFAWTGSRKVKQPDGSTRTYEVLNHAYRRYRALQGWEDMPHEDTVARLPDHWVTAMELEALDHLAMVESVAPYVDTAISKTINVAADYPYERFKAIYEEACRRGLKGVTTFRPSGQVDYVLEPAGSPKADTEEDLDQSDPDRRLRLTSVPEVTLASLRWLKRPNPVEGNPAWTYMVEHPHGHRFAVFVGHIENGTNRPFEIWINGAEQPRGLGALAKSLSMDMRCEDRAFLKTKFDSLQRMAADDGFDLRLPTGEKARMPSLVAGVATLVMHRCSQLGAFESVGKTPVLDALMSPKEPKTGPDGTLSWTVDVLNPAMGDDFVLGLKELTLPDGTRRPFSLWLSGQYPRALDGLCKSLSFDMRVLDPAWIGAKLRQLLDYGELKGEFWAKAPGEKRMKLYPSTVAYIVRLIVHRYAMLGVLDEEGYPMESPGHVAFEEEEAGTPQILDFRHAGAMQVRAHAGRPCPECGNHALIRRDGCDFCTACGALGSCG